MSELVALLDIGSNAARFVLARITPGTGYRVLHRERVVTRLAGGKPGTLPRKGVKAVLRGAHRFLREVCDSRNPRVVAYLSSYGASVSYYLWEASGRPVHGVRGR